METAATHYVAAVVGACLGFFAACVCAAAGTASRAEEAMQGNGTCEDVSTANGIFVCSECGCRVEEDGVDNGLINFCPDCGKAVE